MPKEVNFIYKLDGPGIDEGVNVFELAPTLLSLGELIKESNRTLNPHGREIAVNVKPFEKGSFIVDILLFAQNGYQEIIDFVSQDGVREIRETLEWLGIIGGGSKSLMWLILKLKGKPKTVEQIKPNEVRYTDEENNTYTVDSKVHLLFSNSKIQNFIYNSYGRPLENENIDQVESYVKNEKEETNAKFGREVVQSVKNYSEATLPSLQLEEELSTNMEVFVSPKRGSFDADPRQWSFRLGGPTEQIIKATIRDEDFLEKNRNDEIRLHFTDVLKVRLVQKLKKKDGVIDLDSVTYEVEKVIEYHPAKKVQQAQLGNLEPKGSEDDR